MRVLVAGAGIGGLTASIALRAADVDRTVFEQIGTPGASMVGGGFHIWVNAVHALRELGLDEVVRDRGAPITVTEFRSSTGRVICDWPLLDIARELDAFDVGIGRQDLMSVLYEAAGENTVRAGAKLQSFAEDGAAITATFADGSTESGDALVGADGLRSVVRSALLGSDEPEFAGYVQWQTLIDGAAELIPDGVERITFGPGSRTVMHRVGGDRLFLACVIYGPVEKAGKMPGRKAMLVERFSGWPDPIPAAIERMPEEQIVGLPIYDRKPAKAWGRGRATLLGDAAHPMTTNTSQGGNQAIEDGVVLGRLLRGATDPQAALRAYEKRRIARTSPLVKNSRWISNLNAWSDPLRVGFRDRFFAVGMPRKGIKDLRRAVAEPL